MTKHINWLEIIRKQGHGTSSGFTLAELLIALFVGGLVSTLTWNILIENTKSNVRAEFRRRLHEDWNQATTLLQSEIAMSHSIESNGLLPANVDDDCPLLQHPETRLKLRMNLVGTMPDIIYGVRKISTLPASEANQWMGGPSGGVLIRCGPRMTISEDGRSDYIQGTPYQQSVVLDNLDLSTGDGLSISQTTDSQKLVEFALTMNEALSNQGSTNIRAKTLSSGGVSRINEVPPIPGDESTCETICQAEDVDCGHGVKTLLRADPRQYKAPNDPEPVFGTDTICTNRSLKLGDGIEGANGNYVIDGDPTPNRTNPQGINLNGGKGRNILLGTSADDTLKGGPNHDGLIGRGGNDQLSGEAGNDSLVPWASISKQNSTVSVDGGTGFDRVYLEGAESTYTLSNCNRNSCKLQSISGGGTLYLTNVEMLVFPTSTKRLN